MWQSPSWPAKDPGAHQWIKSPLGPLEFQEKHRIKEHTETEISRRSSTPSQTSHGFILGSLRCPTNNISALLVLCFHWFAFIQPIPDLKYCLRALAASPRLDENRDRAEYLQHTNDNTVAQITGHLYTSPSDFIRCSTVWETRSNITVPETMEKYNNLLALPSEK